MTYHMWEQAATHLCGILVLWIEACSSFRRSARFVGDALLLLKCSKWNTLRVPQFCRLTGPTLRTTSLNNLLGLSSIRVSSSLSCWLNWQIRREKLFVQVSPKIFYRTKRVKQAETVSSTSGVTAAGSEWSISEWVQPVTPGILQVFRSSVSLWREFNDGGQGPQPDLWPREVTTSCSAPETLQQHQGLSLLHISE